MANVEKGVRRVLSTSTQSILDISPSGHVAILLCTYNGERFISQQLDSINEQSHHDWKVWISDDGSTDRTLTIVESYRQSWGDSRIQVVKGPSRGFAANFLSVVCRAEIHADYFAYSDQDDIWEVDKIRRALNQLETLGRGTPTLYCSRTRLVDELGQVIGFSPLFTQRPDFRNALVQNVGGGNTMVFNDAARRLLMMAGPDLDVVAHDWWTYVAVAAAGGHIMYDPAPSLLYRQHGGNLIGSNSGLVARFDRVRLLMQGELRRWIDANVAAIERIASQLSEPNRRIFGEFVSSRQGGVVRRLSGLRRSGVFRQTFMGNVGLVAAAIFKKL